jgi:hypothetical protein
MGICLFEVLYVLEITVQKANRMHSLLSIYFNYFPLHVSNSLTAHHQEVLYYIYTSIFIIQGFMLTFCWQDPSRSCQQPPCGTLPPPQTFLYSGPPPPSDLLFRLTQAIFELKIARIHTSTFSTPISISVFHC